VGAPGVHRPGPGHRQADPDHPDLLGRPQGARGWQAGGGEEAGRPGGCRRAGRVPRGTEATFGSLLDEWTAHSERKVRRSPKTLYEYRRKIDKSIRPDLGATRLDKLSAHDLDKLYARQLDAGLSPSTVLMHHRIIGAALKQGRKWGWVDRNVAEDATPPSARKPEIAVPSPEQVRALISEATRPAAKNPELATIVLLAAITGMRRGELCGLQWRDVEWENAAILVARAVWQTPDGIGTKSPKSHQTRRLLLGEQAMVVLKARASPGGRRCHRGRRGPVA
jgi:integrase